MIEINAYTLNAANAVQIKPAKKERSWLDLLPERFGYRCLPMTIANCYGWECSLPYGFTCSWNGSVGKEGITITRHVSEATANIAKEPISHFGSGILTFHTGFIFQTPPDIELLVTGPFNEPFSMIAPLTGIVETGWSEASFTMNWRFTQIDVNFYSPPLRPFCFIMPVQRNVIEDAQLILSSIHDNPELLARHEAWSNERKNFNQGLETPGSEARLRGWQKDYMRGRSVSGETTPHHRTKVNLKPVLDKRKFKWTSV